MTLDWAAVEAKWRRRWAEARAFEADPGPAPKKFITVAYPYPNSPQHVGHGRTYTLADVHARYWRMRGFNVLLPMAFHYTGTPILGMAKRVEAGDPEILAGLRGTYGVPEEDIRTFAEPVRIASYFHREIRAGMVEMGYSIDWRREFTTIDPGYRRFVEWQVTRLRDMGLIRQGSHPVGWCPRDQNPVSQHDTLGDVEPRFTEYVLVKFRAGGDVLPVATLRPETLFGATNLWVNPSARYVRAEVDGERWVVSAECARKLGFLGMRVEELGEVAGAELAGLEASPPRGGGPVPVLAAGFVEPQTGTGLVMSVPAHAPFDWRALEDLREAGDARAAAIRPVKVIDTEGYGPEPAREACERLGIKSQGDPRLAEATDEVYGKEFYGGTLTAAAGRFAGRRVSECKDEIREWLEGGGHARQMLELASAPVRCRCGAECVVRMLTDQWFLDYGDEKWKGRAAGCLDGMEVLPPEIRGEFGRVLEWLRERACARQRGLGTPLPWDPGWIVESLSDSVIYMAYYVLARFIADGTLDPARMPDSLLDYALLGRGGAAEAAAEAGMPEGALRRVRAELEYFYPVDARHSGRDLVPNHLTFFVLNHVALFPEEHWPRGIVVNGSVLMGGKKMSKSMGNIVPLRQAVREHGADPIRLAIVASAELLQDADFNMGSVAGMRARLEALHAACASCGPGGGGGPGTCPEDRWLAGRLRAAASSAASSIERMRLREALHTVLFGLQDDVEWHAKRAAAKGRADAGGALRAACAARAAMLSPFAPHAADEMWEAMGMEGTASGSRWPEGGEADAAAEQSEGLLRSTLADLSRICRVTGTRPGRICAYVAAGRKPAAYRAVLAAVEAGGADMRSVMAALLAGPEAGTAKSDPELVRRMLKDAMSEPGEARRARLEAGIDELGVLSAELPALARAEFGAEAQVFSEDDPGAYDPKGRARHARPFKPALYVE